MRIALFGDGVWAVNCLNRLLQDGHTVSAVVLRRNPTDLLLDTLARSNTIPVYSPNRVNSPDFVKTIRSLDPELNVSVAYDQIFRAPIIECPDLGFINLHAGKLPQYRGRNVINWALINNEREIGITAHFVDEGIDTGDILIQRSIPLEWDDYYGSVLEKVQNAFPDLLSDAILALTDGQHPIPQKHLDGFYVGGRVDGDEWIDWSDTSLNIYNKIRAITRPGPGSRTTLNQQTLVVWRAHYDLDWPTYIGTSGEVVEFIPNVGVKVKTGDSTIILIETQLSGDFPSFVPDYKVGTRFGHNLIEIMGKLQTELADLRRSLDELKGV